MDGAYRQGWPATVILWTGAVLMLFPTVWMILSAFKSPQELLEYPPSLLPETWSLEFIHYIWTERNFGRMMANSVFVSSAVTLLTVFSSAYIAYVFREFRFRFRMPLLYLVIATTMVPLPVLVLPHFQIVYWLGWLNTYQALIAPYALWGFGIFLLYQFLAGFPHDLIEAARLDGVSERQIFQHIVLPLMKSPCVALGIITFLHQWESLLWPLVAANSPEMQVLPAGLATFSGNAVESADLFKPLFRSADCRLPAAHRLPDFPAHDRSGHCHDGNQMTKRPNIIVVCTDQQRTDTLSCYGAEHVETPGFDRIAKDGMRFSRAYAPSAVCTPSRVSLLSGQYAGRHKVWSIGVNTGDDVTMIQHRLADAGYRTGLIGKAHLEAYQAPPEMSRESVTGFEAGYGDWAGPYYGFERVQLALGHVNYGMTGHYGAWLRQRFSEQDVQGFKSLQPRGTNSSFGGEGFDWDLPLDAHNSVWTGRARNRFHRQPRGGRSLFSCSSVSRIRIIHTPCRATLQIPSIRIA